MAKDHYIAQTSLEQWEDNNGKIHFICDFQGDKKFISSTTKGKAFYISNMNSPEDETFFGKHETQMGNIVFQWKNGISLNKIVLDQKYMRGLFTFEWYRATVGTHSEWSSIGISKFKDIIRNKIKPKGTAPFLLGELDYFSNKIGKKHENKKWYELGVKVKENFSTQYSLVKTNKRMFKCPGKFYINDEIDGIALHPNLILVEHPKGCDLSILNDDLLFECSIGYEGEIIGDLDVLKNDYKWILDQRNKNIDYALSLEKREEEIIQELPKKLQEYRINNHLCLEHNCNNPNPTKRPTKLKGKRVNIGICSYCASSRNRNH